MSADLVWALCYGGPMDGESVCEPSLPSELSAAAQPYLFPGTDVAYDLMWSRSLGWHYRHRPGTGHREFPAN